MIPLLIVFIWIAIWNVVFQILHHSFPNMPIVNWAFFISVTIFFMQEELSPKEKFWHTLVGGAVGLLLAAGIVAGCGALVRQGVPYLGAICPLILLAIGMLILLKPVFPVFFNNVGFCYLIVALVNSSTAASGLPKYLLSLALGSVILNLGCIFLIKTYSRYKKKKMLAAAAAKA